jgi:hypothetical protein
MSQTINRLKLSENRNYGNQLQRGRGSREPRFRKVAVKEKNRKFGNRKFGNRLLGNQGSREMAMASLMLILWPLR